ncbi:pitrilysin family protein [Lysobacter yananisis]
MRLRRSLVPAALAALAVLALAPAAASHAPAPSAAEPAADAGIAVPPLAYTERTLGNGLRVYALPDPDAGEVAVNLWYGVGGRDDPKDRAGLAHLLEHLMFKATRNLPAGRFATLAEEIGGSDDASTEDDYTRYYETVPPAYLERILFAEAERMGALVVDAATLASEREVVKEEIRTRLQSQDFGRLVQADLPAASYARLPYARPAIGRPEDLDRITLAEVRAFRAAYYRPDNAALIVSGRFDPAQLQRWVDRYFGPIARPAQPLPRLAATAEPARRAPLRRSVHAPGTPLPAVVASFALPPDAHPDTPALMALDAIVSRGAGSRLDTRLVQAGHAQAASSLFERRRYGGYLAIYAILAGDADPAAGEAALAAQIDDLRARPVAAAELLRAKRLLLAAALRQRETPDGRALALGRALAVAGDAAADQRQWRALAAVSAADVQRVARAYLRPERAAWLRGLPETAAADGRADPVAVAASVVENALAIPSELPVVATAPESERVPLPAPTTVTNAARPSARELRLDNGLRVILAERRGSPLVALALTAPAGSAADPRGRAGVAALARQWALQGTTTRPAQRIVADAEALGASLGGGVGVDAASYELSIDRASLAPALELLADLVRRPAFAPDAFETVRERALDSLDGALQEPMALARRVAARSVFGASGYGRPAGGDATGLRVATVEDARAAHACAWRPERAALIVVGDIDMARAKALAEAAFGDWRDTGATAALAANASAAGRRIAGAAVANAVGAGAIDTDDCVAGASDSNRSGAGTSAMIAQAAETTAADASGAHAISKNARNNDATVAKQPAANASAPGAAVADARATTLSDARISPANTDALPPPHTRLIDRPDASQAAVIVARPGPARGDPDWPAAAVANAALGAGGSSRLNTELRYRRGLTYDAGSLLSQTRTPGLFYAATLTRPESAAQVATLIQAELRHLGAEPLAPAELDARKRLVVGDYERRLGTRAGLAATLAGFVAQGVPTEQLRDYPDAIKRVAAEQVQQAAQRWFAPQSSSVTVVGPAAIIAAPLRAAYADVETLTAEDAQR